jgi:2-polyprenyl-3-methyl-5-hydroxy-6-metoxy-1,4-benzoquinol methylase
MLRCPDATRTIAPNPLAPVRTRRQRCARVLDVGCGAGAFAARLADHVEHVYAVDKSAAMIEAAHQRTPANVTCILADVM